MKRERWKKLTYFYFLILFKYANWLKNVKKRPVLPCLALILQNIHDIFMVKSF